jgi:hypothetical protein
MSSEIRSMGASCAVDIERSDTETTPEVSGYILRWLAAPLIAAMNKPDPQPEPEPVVIVAPAPTPEMHIQGDLIATKFCEFVAREFDFSFDQTGLQFLRIINGCVEGCTPYQWGLALETPEQWRNFAALIHDAICDCWPDAPLPVSIH